VIRQVGYDGREFRFNYRLSGACVTNTATPNVVCTGPTCPSVDSWENFQAGWRIHGGVVVATTVIQPNGQSYSNEFTALGVATARTDTQGQKSSAKFDALNRPIELTDVLGRTNKLAYDANGNVVQSIDALGRVKQFTYHAIWNKPTSVTRFDDSGQALTWSFSYNAATGKLQSATNPLGQTTSFTYTSRGELETVVDALGKVSRYEYNLVGDLTKVLNPLLHETRFGYDGAGRRTTLTEPLGFVTTTTYNGIDGVTRTTDARTKNTDMAYDAAGRLESIKNARGNMIETYAYDAGDRIASRKDALQKSETYQYDASARVISSTDRKGQVTTYEYDSEDRVTATVRPEGRTRFSYDLVGRLTEVSNSAGTISYTYDAADRMVRERVVAGTVTTTMTYQYDALDHRVSRAVAGALSDATTYAYDRAGRMIRISYRGQQTLFEYDAAGRLTKRTLPNGIVMIPKYDDADRVTEIGYFSAGGATIEALQYTYDDNGRRLTETRSASRAPETPFTAAYDNADRMTSITLTAQAKTFNLAYDDNGNLSTKTEQGASNVTSYGWDSLNRLVSITGPGVSASFQYDALGRRISRTVNGESTRYVYDGTQAIAEIRPTGIDTLLTTLGVDEVIARYNSSGARVYLTDALNSVLMQTGADGSTLNTYSYSAFGEVSRSGADEGNDIQYTGRENDGTGLYFYRARFYDPVLKRFISQDPLGPGGGVNFYAYVSGNPLSFSDPYGLYGWGDFVGDAANGAAGFGDALSFGLTGYIRRQWDIDSVDKCSTAYQAGYWGEVGLEVVLTLGSGALRHAAVEVGSRAAQAEARHFTRAYRRDQGLSGGFVHHSNPLVGHPGGGTALFPTGGLPASVHSGAWNLQWTADRAAHNAIHASQQRLEAGAAALVNPVTTGARGGAGAAGNCKCR
jgi:RHS repeat-associated protein